MPLTDLPLDQCLEFRAELPVPDDFDRFWERTLARAARPGAETVVAPVSNGLTQVRTYDVTVTAFDGQPVRCWLRLPAGAAEPLGCVVEFLGYSSGRGLPHENLLWASAGYAHLLMDSRGQGWSGQVGGTEDPQPSYPGAVPGFLTRGITDPDTYYYRRLIADAVRCTEAARALPAVDPARVVVTGGSQGGGLALAVAGLLPGLAGVMPDVPFLCNIRRAAQIAALPPYTEIADYLALHPDRIEAVFRTLSYVDAAVLATRATAPALFSIAMMDPICPPSTCFTAYHNYRGAKDLRVYEFNGHEGGGEYHRMEQLAWLRKLIG